MARHGTVGATCSGDNRGSHADPEVPVKLLWQLRVSSTLALGGRVHIEALGAIGTSELTSHVSMK